MRRYMHLNNIEKDVIQMYQLKAKGRGFLTFSVSMPFDMAQVETM